MKRDQVHKIFWLLFVLIVVVWGSLYAVTSYKNSWGKFEYETKNQANNIVVNSLQSDNKLSVVIGGDVMLDRGIRMLGEKYGYEYVFSGIKDFFRNSDISVVNLEGPITKEDSKTFIDNKNFTNSFQFTFATSTVLALSEAGIDIVSLANNHTDNMGYSGFIETQSWLSSVGIGYFGSYWNASSTEFLFEKNGIKIAFVGYHGFQSGLERILLDVERLSGKGYFVIVIPHWGPEYQSVHTTDMESVALQFVARGAGAIVGAHPHVIMDRQWIGQVPVFYSLGNLIFDQYFSPEVMKGQVLKLNIKSAGLGQKLHSIEIYEVNSSSNRPAIINKETIGIELI
jgi:poly-gamma-glutamate synthesis protein (capsule biosynthesis protein)